MRKWKLLEVYHKWQEQGWIRCLWIPGPGFLQSSDASLSQVGLLFLFAFNILYFSKASTFPIMYNNLVRFEHMGPGRMSEGCDLPEVVLIKKCSLHLCRLTVLKNLKGQPCSKTLAVRSLASLQDPALPLQPSAQLSLSTKLRATHCQQIILSLRSHPEAISLYEGF